MRWSEKETLEFVRIYLRHEYLWNPDDVNYKLRYQRQKAYTDIIAELKAATGIVLDEAEVKVKIKNLRSTYAQELAKIRQRSNSSSTYKPTIKWFDEWHKCINSVRRRHLPNRASDMQEQEDPCPEMWISQPAVNENDDNEEADPFVSQTEEEFEHIFKSEPREAHAQSPDSFEPKKTKMKRKHCNLSTDFSDLSYRSSMDSNSQTREDEFDIYGKYIASQLRSMDLQKAIRVQLEIQSIVSEARISSLNGH